MAIPFFHAFRSTNRGRGPKYTVPCPKGKPRRTRRQGEDAERRRAQKDISGPAVHADGGTGGRHSPLLSDGGMVGQRRPGDVYKMRLQIGVHNGAFCCSGTLMKRRKFNGGKRCRQGFKSPWGRQRNHALTRNRKGFFRIWTYTLRHSNFFRTNPAIPTCCVIPDGSCRYASVHTRMPGPVYHPLSTQVQYPRNPVKT